MFKNLQRYYPDFWFDFILHFPILNGFKPETYILPVFEIWKTQKRKKNGERAETRWAGPAKAEAAHDGARARRGRGNRPRSKEAVDLEIDGPGASSSSPLSLLHTRHGGELGSGIAHLGAI